MILIAVVKQHCGNSLGFENLHLLVTNRPQHALFAFSANCRLSNKYVPYRFTDGRWVKGTALQASLLVWNDTHFQSFLLLLILSGHLNKYITVCNCLSNARQNTDIILIIVLYCCFFWSLLDGLDTDLKIFGIFNTETVLNNVLNKINFPLIRFSEIH